MPRRTACRRCDFHLACGSNQPTMKPNVLLSVLALAMPLAAQDAKPAAENKPEAAQQQLLPNQQAFLNLPEASRKDFMKHLTEANRVFGQQRIFEAIEELDKASAIFKDSPEIYNLRGSCYVEMRSWEKAMAEFKAALALSKDNPSIEFNIGEVFFVTKEWQKALDIFEKVFKAIPADSNTMAMSRLVEFKILLCKKKLGKNDDVKKLTAKYDDTDDSPFYYFAQAVQAYDANDQVKAEEWLASAKRVFSNPQVLAPWQDTLVEYGYIKSFYGEENSSEEK